MAGKITVSAANAADLPQLQALWQTCFADGPAYTGLYFSNYPCGRFGFVARDGPKIAAMVYWFPAALVCAHSNSRPAAYLYAVATHPEYRRRGLCRELMAFAESRLAARGVQAVALVPGGPELFCFYENLGYQTAFFCRETVVTSGKNARVAAVPISAERYRVLRRHWLDHGYLDYAVSELAYQRQLCQRSGGDLVAFSWHGQDGCAIVERDGSRLFIKELLPSCAAEEAAPALSACFDAATALVRTPGQGRPFGMVKWLAAPPPESGFYLGIAFD